MFREKTTVLENKKVAPGHYVLRLGSGRIAKAAKPGQFVQVLCSDASDPLLPRPFSFLNASKNDFSLLYHVVGKGTKVLSLARKGDALWTVGPLGNGFSNTARPVKLLVGGGVGIPPLYHLAESLAKKTNPQNIHIFLGARDKSLLLCQKEFKKLGVRLYPATDNGSAGKKGFVTAPLEDFIKRSDLTKLQIYTCGPTPMLKAVSGLSQKYGIPCEVSVEAPMACGFGACIGCAIKVKDKNGPGHRYAISCSEGPVFEAKDITWD